MSNYRNFKDYHIEQLRDPEDAKLYLSVALEDYEQNRDIEAFLLAVRDVTLTRYEGVCLNQNKPSNMPSANPIKKAIKHSAGDRFAADR